MPIAENFSILTVFTIKMSAQIFYKFLKKNAKMAFPGLSNIAWNIGTKNQPFGGIIMHHLAIYQQEGVSTTPAPCNKVWGKAHVE